MWKMIIGQSIYQLAVTFTLYFAGARILNYNLAEDKDGNLQKQLDTIVFNTFVWMQIFNEFNNRRLDNKFNIFEGMLRNYWFLGINCLMVGGQIMIIFIGGAALSVTRINGTQWAICILSAFFCMPFAVLLRCIPDRYVQVIIDIVSTASRFVWYPFRNVMKTVFSPIGNLVKAVCAPVGRFFRRLFSREGASENGVESGKDDEEAQRPVELRRIEKKPGDDSGSAPVAPPPITLTGPN